MPNHFTIHATTGVMSCILITILCFSFSSVCRSQQSADDVVYLKDGSIIRGKIFEEVPKKYVKMQTPDGKIREFKMAKVKSINHAPSQQPPAEVEAVRDTIQDAGSNTSVVQPSSPVVSMQPAPSQVQLRPVAMSEARSPAVSFVLSFFIPGLGQYYNGEYTKGGIQTGAFLAGVGMMVFAGKSSTYSSNPYTDYGYYGTYTYYNPSWEDETTAWMYIGAGVAVSSWIWSMIDAPLSSRRINELSGSGGYSHMIQMQGEKYALGLDFGPQTHGIGARAVR